MSITNDDLLVIRQLLEQTMDEKLHPFHECLTTCAGRANQILEQLNDVKKGVNSIRESVNALSTPEDAPVPVVQIRYSLKPHNPE